MCWWTVACSSQFCDPSWNAAGDCSEIAHESQRREQRYVAASTSQRLQNGKAHSSPGLRSNGAVASDHMRWTLDPNDDEGATQRKQQIDNGISNGYSHPAYHHEEGEPVTNHPMLRRSMLRKRSHSGTSSTSSDEDRYRHQAHPRLQESDPREQQPHRPVAELEAEFAGVATSGHHSRTDTRSATPLTSVKPAAYDSNGDARGRQPVQHVLSSLKRVLRFIVSLLTGMCVLYYVAG